MSLVMGPGHPTKVLGKRSVPVELDYSITPGDWDKPLNRVLFGLWPHTTPSPQTNKKTNTPYARLVHPGRLQPQISLHHSCQSWRPH
jgi:hypothetical protein